MNIRTRLFIINHSHYYRSLSGKVSPVSVVIVVFFVVTRILFKRIEVDVVLLVASVSVIVLDIVQYDAHEDDASAGFGSL